MAQQEKQGWFDKPGNTNKFLKAFFASLVVLLAGDFFIHKHGDFAWENTTNFFAAYGFISCVMLVLVAKILRKLMQRREDYYDR